MRELALELMHEIQYCCVSSRLDYTNSAWKSVGIIASGLTGLLSDAQKSDNDEFVRHLSSGIQKLLPELLNAQRKRDIVLVTDILEADYLPWLAQVVEESSSGEIARDFDFWERNLNALTEAGNHELRDFLVKASENVDCQNSSANGRIRCEYAASGDVTFVFQDEDIHYLMGRNYPYSDALNYIYEERDAGITGYCFGTGVMIYELLAMFRINISTKMTLIEHDKEMLVKLFKHFDLAQVIRSERLTICYKDILKEIAGHVLERSLLTKPATVLFERDDKIKMAYEKYRRIMISSKEEDYLLYFNFKENTKNKSGYVTDIEGEIEGKSVYLVAGGPSLNPCLDHLKSRDPESRILCVGTSAGKLLSAGIDPDFVIISDPLPEMKRQLSQNFDYKKTSLLFLSTTYNYAVESFGGSKYIVYQKDFEKAEELALRENRKLFMTGGSVSTLALDILLQLKADKVICLGLDLAYTYNQMHAAGIHKINDVSDDEMFIVVKSTNGEQVSTVSNLNSYREWIVERLKDYHGETELINVSDGAYIEGMKNVPCSDYHSVM